MADPKTEPMRQKPEPHPTQQLNVQLNIRTLVHALELVESGHFQALDDVVNAGIEAVYSKSGTTEVVPREVVTFAKVPAAATVGWPEASEIGTPRSVAPLPASHLPHPLLPITAPRFLPSKPILRTLAAELLRTNADSMSAVDFRRLLRYRAFSWTATMRRLDSESGRPVGERLATAFPSAERDQEKSMDRFLEAYVGSAYAGSPRISGVLPFLAFVSLNGQSGHERIGITASGLAFAGLSNPVLDERDPAFPPFRNEEVAQIVSAIRTRSPDEHANMRYYVETVAAFENPGRHAVASKMRNFYVRYWSPLDLNANMVESLRATVHSRCQELGFVRTMRQGRTSSYAVTEIGFRWLRGEFPRISEGGET